LKSASSDVLEDEHVSTDGDSDRARRFERHVLVYLDDLYRAALRLTRRAPDAEDLVQETCLRAFRALDQLEHLSAARAWLFAILRSTSLREFERRSTRARLLTSQDLERAAWSRAEATRDSSVHFVPIQATLLHEARHAILKLPAPYREAIILNHLGGFSYPEMARILAVPMGTVMSRLFRGRQRGRRAVVAADPERQRPQAVDLDGLSLRGTQPAEPRSRAGVERFDPAVAEVPDQQRAAEFTEALGSDGQSPR